MSFIIGLFAKKTLSSIFKRHNSTNTIFALSSGHGKCGVAVIRVSGSQADEALRTITDSQILPKPRTAVLRCIIDPNSKETLDKGLVLWFPEPNSFTGENSFELQVHGGVAVVNSILNSLSTIPKLRLAEPGEFTRRAFFNGKLDLTEVEGVADLLEAETEAQRKQAFLQTQGALSRLYNNWRGALTKSVAHLEAYIDFDETETIDEDLLKSVEINISSLGREIQMHLDDGRKGEMLRNGVKTVILGAPNVGKSSLLNTLCQRPAAIVTPLAGTTRDILEVTLNIEGYPLVLTDTAGLRSHTSDVIEIEGITRALKSYDSADLVILVIDSEKLSRWFAKNPNTDLIHYLKHYVKGLNLSGLIDEGSHDFETIFKRECIVVLNKVDLLCGHFRGVEVVTSVSCKLEEGVSNLVDLITDKLRILCGEPTMEHPCMNQARHRNHLSKCLEFLNSYLSDDKTDLVLRTEHLRRALKELGHLVGTVSTDQLLDVIFKDFCIGK